MEDEVTDERHECGCCHQVKQGRWFRHLWLCQPCQFDIHMGRGRD